MHSEVRVDIVVYGEPLTCILTPSMCCLPEPVMLLLESLQGALAMSLLYNKNAYPWPIMMPFLSHTCRVDSPALSVSSKHFLGVMVCESRVAKPIWTNPISIDPHTGPVFRHEPISIFSCLRVISSVAPRSKEWVAGTVHLFRPMPSKVAV
jgi:hypothetical protein